MLDKGFAALGLGGRTDVLVLDRDRAKIVAADDVLAILREALKKVCNSEEYIQKAGEEAGLPIKYYDADEIAVIYQESNEALKALWSDLGLPTGN